MGIHPQFDLSLNYEREDAVFKRSNQKTCWSMLELPGCVADFMPMIPLLLKTAVSAARAANKTIGCLLMSSAAKVKEGDAKGRGEDRAGDGVDTMILLRLSRGGATRRAGEGVIEEWETWEGTGSVL